MNPNSYRVPAIVMAGIAALAIALAAATQAQRTYFYPSGVPTRAPILLR